MAMLVGAAGRRLVDDRALGLLFFPNSAWDAAFHLASAATFAAVLLADERLSDRGAMPSGPA